MTDGAAARGPRPELRGEKRCPTCGDAFDADAVFCPVDGTKLDAGSLGIAADPYVGSTIAGDIELTSVLGEGAMGRVYRARQRGIGRDVAVKILLRELSSNVQLVRRFEREAMIASKLRHPHVVEVHLVGRLPDGSLYIVMEYLDGVSLATALETAGGAIPLERVLGIVVQICDAVGEAHALGVVHRDLKPENVMLVRRADMDDWVKVLDFGIAKGTVGGSSMHTASGHIFGTPRYMSPEGVKGGAESPASDVYSLATLAYQMLVGRTPFEGEDTIHLLYQQVHDAPPDLRSFERGRTVPDRVARIVMENLDKDPAKRCRNARAFGAALAAATRAAGIPVHDVGVFSRMGRDLGQVSGVAPTLNDEPIAIPDRVESAGPKEVATSASSSSLAGQIPLNRTLPSSRWMWLALAFVLGGIVTMGVWRLEHRGDEDHSAAIEDVRRAIGESRFVSPPGNNVRELLASDLARWPNDATLLELRADAERAMVTRAMAEHSGGDPIGAYTVTEHALEIEPTNRSAKLLNDEYGAEVRLLTSNAQVTTGSPCLLFAPPPTASKGTTLDIVVRVATRSAGAKAAVDAPKLTVSADRDGSNATSVPLTTTSAAAFAAKLSLPEAAQQLHLTFEATVDGRLLRAERRLDVR